MLLVWQAWIYSESVHDSGRLNFARRRWIYFVCATRHGAMRPTRMSRWGEGSFRSTRPTILVECPPFKC